MLRDNRRLLGRSGKLVPAAAGVMMRDALLSVRGKLIVISLIMATSLRRHWNTNRALSGMRQATRPQHEDKH